MPSLLQVALFVITATLIAIVNNLVRQVLFVARNEPPVVFHWIPFVGSTVAYNTDPNKFLYACREKYGDIFTFILWGRKTTVYLDTQVDNSIHDNAMTSTAEKMCGPLCSLVSSSAEATSHANARAVEEDNVGKPELVREILASHVRFSERKVLEYTDTNALTNFRGNAGTANAPDALGQIDTLTTSQDIDDTRDKLSIELINAFRDLEKGFDPVNFVFPWASLLRKQNRESSRAKVQEAYMQIIRERRAGKDVHKADTLSNLMRCVYDSDEPDPDKEVAHIMTAFMESRHAFANISAWIILHLAHNPGVAERLYAEQVEKLTTNTDGTFKGLQLEDLERLTLHSNVVKETIRVYCSTPVSLRETKGSTSVPGTDYTIPSGHVIATFPLITTHSLEHSSNPNTWNPHRWENDWNAYKDGEKVPTVAKSLSLASGTDENDCIGERLAYINLIVITATLIRTFKFWNLAGIKRVPDKVWSGTNPCPQQPAMIKWERRGGGEKVR